MSQNEAAVSHLQMLEGDLAASSLLSSRSKRNNVVAHLRNAQALIKVTPDIDRLTWEIAHHATAIIIIDEDGQAPGYRDRDDAHARFQTDLKRLMELVGKAEPSDMARALGM